MIMVKKSQLLILVVLLCCSLVSATEQPESVERELHFTMSEESMPWQKTWSRFLPKDLEWKPAYGAVFHLKHVRNWEEYDLINVNLRTRSRSPRPMLFERWEWEKESKVEPRYFYLCLPKGEPKVPMDRREVDFDDVEDEEIFEMGRIREPEIVEQPETNVLEIWVYANSEEKAQDNAKIVIELIGQLAYAPMEELKRNLRLLRERIEKYESEIPELERKYKEIEREIEEHKKTVHYRHKEDAERSILHWMEMLSAIEVDLVGIKARLSKIKELKEKGYGSSLRVMQAATEVDLAGALARKEAAQTFRQKAVDFVALSRESYILSENIPAKQQGLSQLKKKVPFIEKKLSNLIAAGIQPVEVVNNEVVIHPVQ